MGANLFEATEVVACGRGIISIIAQKVRRMPSTDLRKPFPEEPGDQGQRELLVLLLPLPA